MTEPNPEDVKPGEPVPTPPEGTPTPGQEPLPGQPEPTPSSEPQPDGKEDGDKTVPLAALHEERNKRQELQAELEILRQVAGDNVLFDINGRPVQATHQPQQPVQQQQPASANAELEKLWEEDPRKAVRVEIMAAMSYRDQQEANVDSQIQAASTKHEDFSHYEQTIRQYIRALPLEQRSKPGVVDLAYYVVKGQNSSSAIERAKTEMLKKIQAGQGVQGLQPGTLPPNPTPKGPEITEEQMRVADAMGLTIEQYMSQIK